MHELGPFTFWELLVLIVGGTALLGWAGTLLTHRRLSGRIRDGHNEVVVPLYATAAVIYAVLLAFIVIAVWEQFSAANDNAAGEASTLATMYRETQAMPARERASLRHLIREYTDGVVDTEWKVQSQGGTSPAARNAIVQMYDVIGKEPRSVASDSINTQFVGELSTMTSDRTKRLLATQDRLPWVMWLGLILGGLVVVVAGCVLYMQSMQLHAALSGIVAALIGVLLFSTLVLDRPFQGRFGITPDQFEHATSVYNAVDLTPG
jgi:putative Ca2+/H+ antiporter (TMEM165/GDT1 family)